MTTDGFCFDYRKDSSYGESSFVYCSADPWGRTLQHPVQSPMAGICSQTCAGAADCSSLTWKGRQAREEAFYNSGSAPRRLVEEWPAALGFGSLITNFPLTDAQFSCRKVRTLPPEEQPSALAAGSYKKYHTLLPPCVLSRLGRQSGFFPRKAACLAGHTALQGGGKGGPLSGRERTKQPPFGMPEGGLRIYQSCLTV